jgi:hypothetical protein
MNVWLRRLLLLLFVLFWLALILTPTLAFVLARNGQVQLGPSNGRHWRLFLVQEAQLEGLGLERGRPVPPPVEAPPTATCLQTRINYWMWVGEGQPATYCQCQDSSTGEALAVTPPACLAP